MFFEVTLDNTLVGFAVTSAEKGQTVRVQQRGFVTTDDGETLYTYLDNISTLFLNKYLAQKGMAISQIDRCLITINKQKVAKVYINDFPVAIKIVGKGAIQKEQRVTKEDIADIREVTFPTIEIQPDNGIVYIFSHGWRRALYFDFTPIEPDSESYLRDLAALFARFYTEMFFKELFTLDDSILEDMYDSGWFPFIRILGNKFETLYDAFKNRFSVDPAEEAIIKHFDKDTLQEMLSSWMAKDVFRPHGSLLKTGIERYIQGDFISAISALFPRIEGILRYVYLERGGDPRQTALLVDNLSERVSGKCLDTSLFLPDKFRDYLNRFYFDKSDLKTGKLDISRHSIGHGVAGQEGFNQVKALQGILILDQIFYYV